MDRLGGPGVDSTLCKIREQYEYWYLSCGADTVKKLCKSGSRPVRVYRRTSKYNYNTISPKDTLVQNNDFCQIFSPEPHQSLGSGSVNIVLLQVMTFYTYVHM